MTRRALVALLASASLLLAVPGSAMACSSDATAWFETFLDASSCVDTTVNTEFDPLGGLRLSTSATVTTTTWDSADDFTSPQNPPSTVGYNPIGVGTLAVANTPDRLVLPSTSLALSRDISTSSVVSATPPEAQGASFDSASVSDPAVIKVGAQYVMYYSGYAEDGSGPAIFRATSSNGTTFTKVDGADAGSHADAVLEGGADGDFDEHGVYSPDVLYEPSDAAAPYKMWFSGRGDLFGAIGYATSTDGVTWTKTSGAVLDHGRPGSPDTFSAADPTVLFDGGVWKMWYTGDDSDIKRIAYATAEDPEGPWTKGGTVIDASGGNFEFGAFAPTVWKDGNTFRSLFVGRKEVGSNTGDFQTKIISGSSSDGIDWSGFSIEINSSGGAFDSQNLEAPETFLDGSTLRQWWGGDQGAGGPVRIGSRDSGSPPVTIDLGTPGDAFDSRNASGASFLKEATANPDFVGVYWGARTKADGRPRLGLLTSPDGMAVSKVVGTAPGGSIIADGGTNDFHVSGQRDPSLTFETGTYRVYFTGIEGSVESIGVATSTGTDINGIPNAWTDPGTGANAPAMFSPSGVGASFDETGVSQPYVVKDGATYSLFYTARSATGVLSIGRATSAAATSGFGSRFQVLSPQAGTFEKDGIKDPVVWLDGGGTWHMLYTGVENFDEDGDGVTDRVYERTGHATATSPTGTWTRDAQPFVLGPSQGLFAPDQDGASAQGALVDGTVTHVWYSGKGRDGRPRGAHATRDTAIPSPPVTVPNGFATYQFGNNSSGAREFREIVRDSTGDVELWMSVLQPYSPKGGEDFWSNYFPVAVDPGTSTEQLDLLLTIQGVRWQARMKDPSSSPQLDKVELNHAPVQFVPGGSARTSAISPPSGQLITNWNQAEVETDLYGSGPTGGTVRVLNAATDAQVASAALNVGGTTTINLSSVPVASNPDLRLVFELTSASPFGGSPLVRSAKVSYFTNVSQPPPAPPPAPVPPPPPPAPVLTLATTTPVVTFGKQATLTGNLSQAGAPLAGATVGLLEQPLAAPAFTPLPGAATDASGNYTSLVTPQKKTVYKATFAGAASEPTVTVAVNHAVSLKVVRKRGIGTFTGKVGPNHTGKVVTIQQRKSGRWVSFKSAKTGSLSTFRTTAKLSMKAKYQFRARTLADAEHGEGFSPVVLVDKHKVSLSTKLSGKTITFAGKVSPAHPGKTVLLKQLKGTRFVTIAKIKLSRRSTYTLKRRFKAGTYKFRADMPADTRHFAGQSPVRTVTVK